MLSFLLCRNILHGKAMRTTTVTMFPFLCSFLFSSKVIFALFFVYLVFYGTFSVVKHTRKSNNLPVFSNRIVILLYSLDWALPKSVLRIMLFQGIWSLKFQLPFFLLTHFYDFVISYLLPGFLEVCPSLAFYDVWEVIFLKDYMFTCYC